MRIQVGDFGLATKVVFDGEKKRTICGTPNYIAPEVLSSRTGHSYEVDLWSIGVILYTLLIGRPPFETSNVKTTYKRIRMNNYSFPEHVQISSKAKDLIRSLLKTEPKERLSLEQILDHSYLAQPFPHALPTSSLACPPSSSFVSQYESTPVSRADHSPQRITSVRAQKHSENEPNQHRSPVRKPSVRERATRLHTERHAKYKQVHSAHKQPGVTKHARASVVSRPDEDNAI